MGGVRRLEHALVHVNNLDQALKFYTAVMGLAEITRKDGIVYLGCGLDKNFDMAIVEGGTGLDHFAMRVDGEEEYEALKSRLKANRVDYETQDKLEPGVKAALRLSLPSKCILEFAIVEDAKYQKPNVAVLPSRSPIAPMDADHINILVPDAKAETEFFQTVLGFRVSDVVTFPDGTWGITFVRMGDQQHDIAINQLEKNPEQRFHHIAWTAIDFGHMKQMIDRVCSTGISLEYGPGRQGGGEAAGLNISTYFWEPGGNRFELSAEMPTLARNAPVNQSSFRTGRATAWGTMPPMDSFRRGS